MRTIELTLTQKSRLELRHNETHDGRERDRIKAILLRAEGWTLSMISQALRKHESSIARYIDEYKVSKKLSLSSGGSSSKLTEKQTQKLITHLTENTYLDQKHIIDHIHKTWNITYSIPGINKWLHKNSFSYKKPKSMPYKVDLKKQKAFIASYKRLKKNLLKQESLYFMDAVHPTQATKVTSGWIRTGTDKPIQTTGSRTRLNIVGALRLDHIDKAVTSQYKTINSESIVDFMGVLRSREKGENIIHLIMDGAGYHKAEIVKEEAKKLQIKIHYLPAYSPNLNPIERLWKVMNEKVRNNKCFHNAKDFRESINHFFDDILPKIGSALGKRINDNFQVFNPALSG